MRANLCLPLVVLAVAASCKPQTRSITRPSSVPAVAAKDTATLLVANAWTFRVVNLLDGNGKVLGQLSARSHTVLHHPAGPFKLYVLPEKLGRWGDRIAGTLEAGRLYYVIIGVRYAGSSATVLSPRTNPDAWKERKTYETDLTNVEMDRSRLAGLEEDLGDEVKDLMAQIDKVVAGNNEASRNERIIEPSDGEVAP